MGAFQFFIFFIMVDDVRDGLLLVETLLVDCIFCEVGLDDMELAEMSATEAVFGDLISLVEM